MQEVVMVWGVEWLVLVAEVVRGGVVEFNIRDLDAWVLELPGFIEAPAAERSAVDLCGP